MPKLQVAVLYGGRSGEHEVSLVSGRAVMANLRRSQYRVTPILIPKTGRWQIPEALLRGRFDVVFPVLHGPFGEDGTVQGLLEILGLPYVGSGVLGSAASMDKDAMKRLFLQAGLAAVAYTCSTSRAEIEKRLAYPVFVKPANLGSSVGISKVLNRRELGPALKLAARYDRKILVEQGVDARELECAVLGNEHPEASVVGEIIPGREFYDYEAKYADAGSRTLVPAAIPAATAHRVRAMAIQAFQACECSGLARVDFFLERRTQRVFVNEINTMPGFTPISMYPKLWAASGLAFPALLDRLIALGMERNRLQHGQIKP